MEIYELIRRIRKDMKLSQKQFAEKLHVSFSTVNRWENAHVMPNQLAMIVLINLCEKEQIDPALLQELKLQKD